MTASRCFSHDDFLKQLESVVSRLQTRTIELGKSEQGRPLFAFEWGHGPVRWMAWSQMHGDEFSSTHLLFRWIDHLLTDHSEHLTDLLAHYTFLFFPLVNPDGLTLATRANSEGVDLNRDFNRSAAVETRVLKDAIHDFKPQLCFNLHDQRSIFAVANRPASGSILVPFPNPEKVGNHAYEHAERLANLFTEELMRAGEVHALGKYNDDFYPEAFGDNLILNNTSNILVECGFYASLNRMDVVDWWANALARGTVRAMNSELLPTCMYRAVPTMDKRWVDVLLILEGEPVWGGIGIPRPYADSQDDAFGWTIRQVQLDEFTKPILARLQVPISHETWAELNTLDPDAGVQSITDANGEEYTAAQLLDRMATSPNRD